jgi:hypothetical protein
MPSLRCIVYVSTAVSRLSDEALEALLTDARQFNAQAGVTGVLLYSGGAFLQYMEGPQDGVARAYERVCASRTHHAIYELLSEPIDARVFPDWFMGLSHTTASAMLALQQARWKSQVSELERNQGCRSAGVMLLRGYWLENAQVL